MTKLESLKALAEDAIRDGAHLEFNQAATAEAILKLIGVVELLYDHNEIPALKRSCDKLLEEL